MHSVLVFDIGGTNFRSAVVRGGHIIEVRKNPSISFARCPDKPGHELVSELIRGIVAEIEKVSFRHPSVQAVTIAMPGIVTKQGVVVSAPPLWGNLIRDVPLQAAIQGRTKWKVFVFNDLCGTAMFYGNHPDFCRDADFVTVITLSTGVGSKTVDLKRQGLILDTAGLAGEIGHVLVDEGGEGLPCDCGGRGHLSSYVSGRGLHRLIRIMAARIPGECQEGWLEPALDEESLLPKFADAVHRRDAFAWKILDHATAKLAQVVRILSGAIGVDRYVLVGGLALALGEDLRRCLGAHLAKAGMLGWSEARLARLIMIGIPDDNIGLLGAAQYGQRCLEG